jgi:ferredoxin
MGSARRRERQQPVRIVHDALLCEAHGVCTAIDPARFELDDDDVLTVRELEVTDSDLETARHAVESCPRQALSLSDD